MVQVPDAGNVIGLTYRPKGVKAEPGLIAKFKPVGFKARDYGKLFVSYSVPRPAHHTSDVPNTSQHNIYSIYLISKSNPHYCSNNSIHVSLHFVNVSRQNHK